MNEPTEMHARVSVEHARMLLETTVMDWQRNIAPVSVAKFVDDMKRGNWIDYLTPIQIAETPEGSVLIDGQHRLKAVVESGQPQSFVIQTFVCTMSEAHKLYMHKDVGRMRSVSDQIKAYDGELQISNREFKKLAEAVRLIGGEFTKRAYDASATAVGPSTKIAQTIPWQCEFIMLQGLFNHETELGKRTYNGDMWERFFIAPYIASSIYLLRYQVDMAKVFLQSVIDGNISDPTDPTRRLREFILVHSTKSNRGMGKIEDSRWLKLAWFSRCWNAAYDGMKLQKVYPPKEITFKGTPLK